METFEYSPFADIYVPYLDQPELDKKERERLWWGLIAATTLPFFTRWILYRALKSNR